MKGLRRSIDRSLQQAACIACMLLVVAVTTPAVVSAQIWYGGGGGYQPAGGWSPMGMNYPAMAGMTSYWGMTAPVLYGGMGYGGQGSGYWGSVSPSWSGTGTGFSTYPAYPSTAGGYYGFAGQYGTGTQAQWINASAYRPQAWSSYAGYSTDQGQPFVPIPSGWLNLDNLQRKG